MRFGRARRIVVTLLAVVLVSTAAARIAGDGVMASSMPAAASDKAPAGGCDCPGNGKADFPTACQDVCAGTMTAILADAMFPAQEFHPAYVQRVAPHIAGLIGPPATRPPNFSSLI